MHPYGRRISPPREGVSEHGLRTEAGSFSALRFLQDDGVRMRLPRVAPRSTTSLKYLEARWTSGGRPQNEENLGLETSSAPPSDPH